VVLKSGIKCHQTWKRQFAPRVRITDSHNSAVVIIHSGLFQTQDI